MTAPRGDVSWYRRGVLVCEETPVTDVLPGAVGRADTFSEFSPYRRAVRGTLLDRVLTRRGVLALAHGLFVARSP